MPSTTNATKSRFIIAAPTSDAGKTSVSLGLQRALSNRGKSVQAFKCGPDYIDSKFHELASHGKSFNLDSVMMSEDHVREVYSTQSLAAQVSVVEGVMGLFDGARKSEGSTAELSKKLKTPVILVVDARAVAYSVAPLLHGFKTFDPEVNIAGVIFNKVGSPSHFQFLREASEDVNVHCFGYLKNLKEAEIPSRHLGLSIANMQQYDSVMEVLAKGIEETVDLDALLSATAYIHETSDNTTATIPKEIHQALKIAVAKDEAFNFIYAQVVEQFQRRGKVTFFSPLKDSSVPDCDLLYLPGGYPECYLGELAANTDMKSSIKSYIENNGKVLAECGGFMYLGKSIEDVDGKEYPMVGALEVSTSMKHRKLHLGYRKIKVEGETLIGHEFHYSSLVRSQVSTIGEITDARDEHIPTQLVKERGILASYLHFYFGADKQFDLLWKWIN